MSAECALVIVGEAGGRWVYDMILAATPPEVDDIIHIESSIDQTARVMFELTNTKSTFANFRVSFLIFFNFF